VAGCTQAVAGQGEGSHPHARETSLVLVSHAPLAEIEPFKARMGWNVPWYSSFGPGGRWRNFSGQTGRAYRKVISLAARKVSFNM